MVTGATIDVDCTAPVAVTGITAEPGHNKVEVSWTYGTGTDVAKFHIYRGLWHNGTVGTSAYPEYDDIAPPTPSAGPLRQLPQMLTPNGFWLAQRLVGTNTLRGCWGFSPAVGDTFDPDGDDRGVYYYEVFPKMWRRTVGLRLRQMTARPTTGWVMLQVYRILRIRRLPNGLVESYDITALATTFGLGHTDAGYNNVVDVGPTDDWSRVGIPTTDSLINFEDLIVFSMNFGVVTSAKGAGTDFVGGRSGLGAL